MQPASGTDREGESCRNAPWWGGFRADDDSALGDVYERALKLVGIEVARARAANEALTALEMRTIVRDIRMPGICLERASQGFPRSAESWECCTPWDCAHVRGRAEHGGTPLLRKRRRHDELASLVQGLTTGAQARVGT